MVDFVHNDSLSEPDFRPKFYGWKVNIWTTRPQNGPKFRLSTFWKLNKILICPSFLQDINIWKWLYRPRDLPRPRLLSNYLKNQIFSRHVVSSKGRKGLALTSDKKSGKSLELFLREIEKTSIFTTFWHFFQNFGKTRHFFENRASLLLIIFDCPTPCKKSEKTNDRK